MMDGLGWFLFGAAVGIGLVFFFLLAGWNPAYYLGM
jgi:hypothetical protein